MQDKPFFSGPQASMQRTSIGIPDVDLSRPIHVLVVSNHWKKPDDVTFSSVWVDRQVEALRELGVVVDTFDIGVSHSLIRLIDSWLRLRRTVRELKPDLVHARYGTLIGLISAFAGAPMVITFGGADLLGGAGVSNLRTFVGIALSNVVALRARRIMCVSEELRRALWWRRGEVIVIPDGVNLAHFKPQPRDEARAKLGWRLDEQVVLMDGLRDPIYKGLALAEAAMQSVKKRLPRARLELLKVKPTDMPIYCSAADVLLCTSRREGSPNIVKEAMACNLPVVSVEVGDVPQRLANVVPSRIVERSPAAVANGIVEILQLGQRSNGREHVVELSLARVNARVRAVYEELLREKSV